MDALLEQDYGLPTTLTLLLQCSQYFRGMAFRFHLPKYVSQFAVGPDHKGTALDAHDLLAIHIFFFPDVEGLSDFLFGVSQKRKSDVVFLRKLLLSLG